VDIIYKHDFNLKTKDDFKRIQEKLCGEIILEDAIEEGEIKSCAGVDIAYWQKDNVDYGACSIVLIDYNTHEVIEKAESWGKIDVPYIPGYLAFRELPLIIEAASKLKNTPDLFMFDGNGYLHTRHMGIATHASFFLQKPTIGVAKSYLKIENVEYEMPGEHEGDYTNIIINNDIYGRVLRTRDYVKPVFISSGNYISLETATKVSMSLVNKESRIPIPTRLADLETHILRERFSKI